MKKIFIIDWILIPLFILSAYTGIKLHIVGHGNDHELWHNYAVFHVLTSVLFFIFLIFHITTHWNWYKGIANRGLNRKSKLTLALTGIFIIVVVIGIAVLNISGANSNIGLWHYRIGILMSILSTEHILKRIPILRKSLKRKNKNTK